MIFSLFLLSICLTKGVEITGWIYVDNWFELYFNGEKVATDPVFFTPHNAVKISFTAPDSGLYSYAIWAQDYADDVTGLEDRMGGKCLGDGGIRISLSDGTISGGNWKCFVVMEGPTNTECVIDNECTNNPDECTVQYNDYPSCWNETTCAAADSWSSSTEYTDVDGWGVPPDATQCCGIDPVVAGCSSEYPDGCAPAQQNWGDATFMWTEDLNVNNRIICRYEYCVGGGTDCTAATTVEPTRSPLEPDQTYEPTLSPIIEPTAAPIVEPTAAPIDEPTAAPIDGTGGSGVGRLCIFIAFGISLINMIVV